MHHNMRKVALLLSLPRAALAFAPPTSPIVGGVGRPPTVGNARRYSDTGQLRLALSPIGIDANALVEQFSDPLLYEHMATGAALAFAGDVIAQSLLSESEQKSIPPSDWDVARTSAFVTFGALYTGGAQHFVFAFLNDSFSEPLLRLCLAQFFFIPFCYYPTFLLMVPFLRAGWEGGDEGGGFGSERAEARRDELLKEVAGKIPPTLLRNWCFWLPVQFVQFNFVPADLHVLFTSSFGVIWNAILSWSTSSSAGATSEASSSGVGTTAAEKEA